jgi:hypothetical protein
MCMATEDQIIVSPSAKMQIEDIFNLRSIPIKQKIKDFESIAECCEILCKEDRISVP